MTDENQIQGVPDDRDLTLSQRNFPPIKVEVEMPAVQPPKAQAPESQPSGNGGNSNDGDSGE